jgi:GYF domain 2
MIHLLALAIQLIIVLARFLFTHLVGASLLAVAGLFFLCGGCVSLLTVKTEESATKVSMAEVEKKGLPDRHWLELQEGYLFWPLWKQDVLTTTTTSTQGGAATSREDVKWHYAPLVSKDTADEWAREYDTKGDQAVYDGEKCRVWVKIDPRRFASAFPGVNANGPDHPSAQHTVSGRVIDFKNEPTFVLDSLPKHTRNMKFDRMVLVEYGEQPAGKGAFACMMVMGVPFLIPLGLLLYRNYAKRGPKEAGTTATPAGVTTAAPANAAEASLSGTGYYYAHQGKTLGPVSADELRALAADGKLRPEDSLWKQGMPEWVPAGKIRGLFRS